MGIGTFAGRPTTLTYMVRKTYPMTSLSFVFESTIFCKAGSGCKLAIQAPLRTWDAPVVMRAVGTDKSETVDAASDAPDIREDRCERGHVASNCGCNRGPGISWIIKFVQLRG